MTHESKDRIVTQIARAKGLNAALGPVTLLCVYYTLGLERFDQLLFNFILETSGIALNADYETAVSHTGFETPDNGLPPNFTTVLRSRDRNDGMLIVV